jgi:tetratricopeptide (TPR) repeat protein
LADDLQRYLNGLPILARRLGPWEQSIRWVARNRIASVLMAVILVSLFAVTWLLAVAEQRRELAESKSQEARATVDRLFTETSKFLAIHPHSAEVRHSLLTAARDAYERFRRERSHDPQIEYEAATAVYRLAQVEGDLHNEQREKKLAREALSRFQDLSKRFPDNEAFRFDIFHCHFLLRQNTEALGVISELCQGHSQPQYRDALAAVAAARGGELLRRGDTAAARRMFELGLTTAEKLSGDFPKVASYRRHIGTNARHLSHVSSVERDFSDALFMGAKGHAGGPRAVGFRTPQSRICG